MKPATPRASDQAGFADALQLRSYAFVRCHVQPQGLIIGVVGSSKCFMFRVTKVAWRANAMPAMKVWRMSTGLPMALRWTITCQSAGVRSRTGAALAAVRPSQRLQTAGRCGCPAAGVRDG